MSPPIASPGEIRPLSAAGVAGQQVLVRADLNTPLTNGRVADNTRIRRFVPTALELLAMGAKRVVILTHLGRPDGAPEKELSVTPVVAELGRVLGEEVQLIDGRVGAGSQARVRDGARVCMLENLRFDPGEENNDPAFARRLAAHGDVFVNDAFSCSHRAHASLHALARLLPAFAGLALMAEISALQSVLAKPSPPAMAIVGGAKVSSKIAILEHLAKRMDSLAIGGGMANTFLAAQGLAIGRSLFEPAALEVAHNVLCTARAAACEILLPVDVVMARDLDAAGSDQTVAAGEVPEEMQIFDLGRGSVEAIWACLERSKSLLWNGTLGVCEVPPFERATHLVAERVASLCQAGRLVGVAGGGETVAALNDCGVADQLTYVSTAGGAFLKWMEGAELPGIAVLRESHERVSS